MIELGRLPNLRKLIVPDDGMVLIDMDLERADLYAVGWDSGCTLLQERLRSEDVHTRHALDFLGKCTKYERDLMKKLAHAGDYLVGPRTASMQTGLAEGKIKEFLNWWYVTYPEIKEWHNRVKGELYDKRVVRNAFGYRRPFFDRVESCLPEAVAWIAQCLTSDHEVLTRNGWKPISNIIIGEDIAIFSQDSGHIYFSAVTNFTHGIAKAEELIGIEGCSFSALCTNQHKWPYKNAGRETIKIAETQDMPKQARLVLTGQYDGGALKADPNWIRLLVAYQADGWIDEQRGALQFEFKRERKIQRMREILGSLGVIHTETVVRRGSTCFYINKDNNPLTVLMKTSGPWLLSYSKDNLETFIAEIVHWDGHLEDGETYGLTTTNYEQAQWVCTIAHLCGYRARFHKTDCREGRVNPLYRIAFNKNKISANWPSLVKTKQALDREVFCPEVTTGLFLVRRNNSIMISGNSTVAIVINKALDNICTNLGWVQPLLQVHDSLTLQVPTQRLDEAIPLIRAQSLIPVPYPTPLIIPVSFKVSTTSWGDVKDYAAPIAV